eukprot:TRINITY_DN8315_c0_g1_i3.p2 TRINITY_DN8315_c0_g1~~TRINITY_DN8315_c0_g1_i3.p2  ORF type:complete len:125 (-),score=14.41 TRINITY_DN8315_c0_g1_i3:268-642(-)
MEVGVRSALSHGPVLLVVRRGVALADSRGTARQPGDSWARHGAVCKRCLCRGGCRVKSLAGYGACQERRRQMLVEAGVKRYKQDTMERLDRIRRVPEEKDPLVEKELWPGGLAELECSDCDEEL